MNRALLLCLIALPAWADQATNFAALVIRDRAAMVTNPPLREPTDDELLLEEARKIIDQGRELAQATVDRAVESKRITLARKYLDVTDPVARPVELGP